MFDDGLHGEAKILRLRHDHQPYVVLDRTWLYAKGGGQKSDRGRVAGMQVIDVQEIVGDVLHFVAEPLGHHTVGDAVDVVLEAEWRRRNSQLHSAGHLVALVVEELCGGLAQAVAGHHWPGEARVDFLLAAGTTRLPRAEEIDNALTRAVAAELPIRKTGDHEQTLVHIGDAPPVACGGTHVLHTGELVGLKVRKLKVANERWCVSYDC